MKQPQFQQDEHQKFELYYNTNSAFVIGVKKKIASGINKTKEISEKIAFLNDWSKIILEDRIRHDAKKKRSEIDRHENKQIQFDHLIDYIEFLIAKYKPIFERELKLAMWEQSQHPKSKDKFSINQQSVLLNRLRFFEIDEVKKLTKKNQAKLLSHLLNRGEQSLRESRIYLNKVNPKDIKIVNDLLSKLGLKQIL